MEDESGAKSYEDVRKQRLLENKRRLEELGLEKLSKALSVMKKLEEKPKRQFARPKGPKATDIYAVEPRRSSRARKAVSSYRDNMDSKFAIYWTHGGKFLELEGSLLYKWGSRRMQSGLDLDRIRYLDLLDEVKKMGYDLKKMCYKVPKVLIMYAMREIKDDKQVMEMVHIIKKRRSKFIEVFLEGQDQDELDAFVEKVIRKRGRPRKKIVAATGQRKRGRPRKNAGPSGGGGAGPIFDEKVAERGVSEGGEAEANDPNLITPVKVIRKRGRPRKNAGPSGGGEAGPSGGERPSGGAGPIFDEKVAERGVSEGGEAEANDPNLITPVKVIRKRGRPRKDAGPSGGEGAGPSGRLSNCGVGVLVCETRSGNIYMRTSGPREMMYM